MNETPVLYELTRELPNGWRIEISRLTDIYDEGDVVFIGKICAPHGRCIAEIEAIPRDKCLRFVAKTGTPVRNESERRDREYQLRTYTKLIEQNPYLSTFSNRTVEIQNHGLN